MKAFPFDGATPGQGAAEEKFHGGGWRPYRKTKTMDYVTCLLEVSAAKRRIARLFESEAPGRANRQPAECCDRNHSVRIDGEHICKRFLTQARADRHGRDGITAVRAMTKPRRGMRDLSTSSLVLALVLVGVVLAGFSDRPVFWLLIGPVPLGILHTLRTFVRQRLNKPEGTASLNSCSTKLRPGHAQIYRDGFKGRQLNDVGSAPMLDCPKDTLSQTPRSPD